MKSRNVFFIFLLTGISGFTQNLVPNPGFEEFSNCPDAAGEISLASPWFQPAINNPALAGSDLYNTCAGVSGTGVPYSDWGFQLPRAGNSQAGIRAYWSIQQSTQYIEVPLLSPLLGNTSYCVEFYVSLANNSSAAISNIGAYFSVDSLLDTTIQAIELIPQVENPDMSDLNDTTGWSLVSGSFIAAGGERYMTIGNFNSPANTNMQIITFPPQINVYYYIDDVSVYTCEITAADNPGKPDLIIYPNPFNFSLSVDFSEKVDAEIKLKDISGKTVKVMHCTGNKIVIPRDDLNAGIYFLEIIKSNSEIINRKIIIE